MNFKSLKAIRFEDFTSFHLSISLDEGPAPSGVDFVAAVRAEIDPEKVQQVKMSLNLG